MLLFFLRSKRSSSLLLLSLVVLSFCAFWRRFLWARWAGLHAMRKVWRVEWDLDGDPFRDFWFTIEIQRENIGWGINDLIYFLIPGQYLSMGWILRKVYFPLTLSPSTAGTGTSASSLSGSRLWSDISSIRFPLGGSSCSSSLGLSVSVFVSDSKPDVKIHETYMYFFFYEKEKIIPSEEAYCGRRCRLILAGVFLAFITVEL